MDKDEMIKAEMRKYKKLFRNIDKDKQQIAEKLYKQAAFMTVTLDDLQEKINHEGAVLVVKNGNGIEAMSEHPAQKSYNVMIRNYSVVMGRLVDMLPDGEKEADELLEFIGRGKK